MYFVCMYFEDEDHVYAKQALYKTSWKAYMCYMRFHHFKYGIYLETDTGAMHILHSPKVLN